MHSLSFSGANQKVLGSLNYRKSGVNISVVAEAGPTSEGSQDEQEDDSRACAILMAEVADGVKAEDILVLHVEHVCSWTRYFVLVTARSRPQMDALMVKMRDAVNEKFGRDFQKNSESGGSAWAVMDLGDVVAHVFSPQEREYYDLESFYQDADMVELPFPSSTSRW